MNDDCVHKENAPFVLPNKVYSNSQICMKSVDSTAEKMLRLCI